MVRNAVTSGLVCSTRLGRHSHLPQMVFKQKTNTGSCQAPRFEGSRSDPKTRATLQAPQCTRVGQSTLLANASAHDAQNAPGAVRTSNHAQPCHLDLRRASRNPPHQRFHRSLHSQVMPVRVSCTMSLWDRAHQMMSHKFPLCQPSWRNLATNLWCPTDVPRILTPSGSRQIQDLRTEIHPLPKIAAPPRGRSVCPN